MADVPTRQFPAGPLLRSSFQHLPGITQKREAQLWSEGIVDWDDVIERTPVQLDLLHRGRSALHMAIEESETALAKRDVAFFKCRLPKREYYRIAASFPESSVFLDIETTGLSTYYDRVTVVGWSAGGQYSALIDPNHTESLDHDLRENPIVVTFNGTLFDLPFLAKRFGTDWSFPTHVDLRYLARRVGLTGGQKKIELETGFSRESSLGEITGADAVALWFDYKEGNLTALRDLVRYNHADIEGMKYLFEVVLSRLDPGVANPRASTSVFPRSQVHFSYERETHNSNTVMIDAYRGPVGPRLVFSDLYKHYPKLVDATIVGIDLTGSEKRKSGWAAVTGQDLAMELMSTDVELIEKTLEVKPSLVSIDSPLSLPTGRLSEFDDDPGRDKYGIVRAAERQLRKRGINVYPALLPSMQRLTHRGVELATNLRKRGIPVIESYPGAAQDILGIPRKKTSMRHLVNGLHRFGYTGLAQGSSASHDELDAATSALVGQFYLAGYWEALGSLEEDYLIVPTVDPLQMKCRPSSVVGLSGPIAAGKTTAADILKRLGFRYCRFSEVIAKELRERGKLATRETMQAFGDQAQKSRFGQRQLQNKLAAHVEEADRIVVDGLRHPEDRAFLHERWCGSAFHIHIDASKSTRAKRYSNRSGKSEGDFLQAEAHEVERHASRMQSLADMQIDNSGTIDELRLKLQVLVEEGLSCQ